MKNNYTIIGEKVHIEIKVKGRLMTTVIDLVDLDRVATLGGTWSGDIDSRTGKIYVTKTKRTKRRRERISLQRTILGLRYGDGFIADHLDHNTLNNTRANLRAVSFQRNVKRKLTEISIVRRVVIDGQKHWGVIIHGEIIGTYKDKNEAQIMSVIANMEHFPHLQEFICFDSVLERLGVDLALIPIKRDENGELDYSLVTREMIEKATRRAAQ